MYCTRIYSDHNVYGIHLISLPFEALILKFTAYRLDYGGLLSFYYIMVYSIVFLIHYGRSSSLSLFELQYNFIHFYTLEHIEVSLT